MQCDHFDAGRCRSCTLMGTPYAVQLADKQVRAAERLAAAAPGIRWLDPAASPESHYRNKAKLVVGGRVGSPTLGILDERGRGVDLRSCGLYEPGLAATFDILHGLVADLRHVAAETARSAGIDVEVRVVGDVVDPGPEAATALVRSARGLLANVAEHAAASRAVLTVTFHEDAVSLDVLDDGRGFVAADGGHAGMRGHGLAGIQERVATLGGRLDVESTPGAGTDQRPSGSPRAGGR